jgi:hypothetical protein
MAPFDSVSLRTKAERSNPPPWNKATAMRLGSRVSMDLVGSDLILHAQGKRAAFPREFLDLLAFYQKPHSLEEGVHFLCRSAKSAQGIADAFARLIRLCEQGVLVPEEGADSPTLSQSYNQPYGQIPMLEDRARTSGFVGAIRSTVQPGDIVVDLGTGSGVLAVAAAQAGARRVYAIEVRPIATTAARFFKASGYGDRITLIRGLSMEIALPERGDVLVSEMIGNEPLAEQILETTRDAVTRMLKPGARLIPFSLRILATPVVVPERFRRKVFFTPELLDRWQRWYGLPFRGLLDPIDPLASQSRLVRTFVNPWSARRWPTLGPPAHLQAFDLAVQSHPPFESETTLYLQREGNLGGFLIHFEAVLAEGISITTEPRCVDRSNHWRSPLWLLPSVLKVKPGEKLLARSGWSRTSTFEIVNQP